jgi:hypothetical protein
MIMHGQKIVKPISEKVATCCDCDIKKDLLLNCKRDCPMFWDVGTIEIEMTFERGLFNASAKVEGFDFKMTGDTWDDAKKWLAVALKGIHYTGVLKVVRASDKARYYKDKYYYKTSPIPGDTYSELITPRSSMRDRCRSLCE